MRVTSGCYRWDNQFCPAFIIFCSLFAQGRDKRDKTARQMNINYFNYLNGLGQAGQMETFLTVHNRDNPHHPIGWGICPADLARQKLSLTRPRRNRRDGK